MAKNRRKENQTNVEPVQELVVTEPGVVIQNNGDTLALQSVVLSPTISDVADVPASAPTLRSLADAITLERAAYVVVAIVALVLRTTNLDSRPLAPSEAQTAAAAWAFLNGQPVGDYASPLLFSLDWLAFFLFGAFDLTARVFPAVLGTLLVFIPLLARTSLGRMGAFLAAIMIAVSPTLVFIGRSLSGADLAVGGAVAALFLLNEYRQTERARALYAAAVLGAVSLTADAAAFTILIGGLIYLLVSFLLARRADGEQTEQETEIETKILQRPLVRAAILFVATYVIVATTFLLNRDGLGVAFNLLGEWFQGLAGLGSFTSPLRELLVYEPLTLIFGIAAMVLVFTLRTESLAVRSNLYLLASIALFSLLFYTLVDTAAPDTVVAVVLPLTMLAAWFVGNLLERARDDIEKSGGWSSTLAGEIPVLVMLLILAALVYLQAAAFTNNSNFSAALQQIYTTLGGAPGEASLTVAAATLALISLVLLGVFVGLSILLVGVGRTTTLLAIAILIVLGLGTLRATWQLNFSSFEPLRELVAGGQTPEQIRDMVRDLEFMSSAREGDPHIMFLAVDPSLGAPARWYLRNFVNFAWSDEAAALDNAGAIVTTALSPPTGDWMGQRYQVGTTWEPSNMDGIALWRWFMFREGGQDFPQSVMVWFPTPE